MAYIKLNNGKEFWAGKHPQPKPMSLLDWLQLMLVYLKLTNQIDWDWGAVLMPLWLPVVIVFVLALIFGRREK